MKKFCLALFMLVSAAAFAQNQGMPAEQEKQLMDKIQEEVEKYELSLELEYWQVFRVDSTLTHDYMAMYQELMELNKKKISNSDIYEDVKDKWMEASYQSFHSILSEEQWAKYLKQGAAREKKAREKRIEKRNNNK